MSDVKLYQHLVREKYQVNIVNGLLGYVKPDDRPKDVTEQDIRDDIEKNNAIRSDLIDQARQFRRAAIRKAGWKTYV